MGPKADLVATDNTQTYINSLEVQCDAVSNVYMCMYGTCTCSLLLQVHVQHCTSSTVLYTSIHVHTCMYVLNILVCLHRL